MARKPHSPTRNQDGPDSGLARLVAEGLALMSSLGEPVGHQPPARWLLVDVRGQRLALVRYDRVEMIRPVSTASVGLDNRQDSGGTPPGLHRIKEKIGGDAPPGTIFVGRRPSGELWPPGRKTDEGEDLILTRILTLEGRQEGVNRGPGVDSLARFIYIHGTNHEDLVGTPVSHGCIRMTNDDVVELFELVEPGDPVLVI